MATQQDLLNALQGLTQQSYTRSAPSQMPSVAPTGRTATPPAAASKFPTLTSTVAGAPQVGGSPAVRMKSNQLTNYATQQSVNYPKLTDQINSAAAGKSEPSGALGVLGNILNNPVAKVALAPLMVLDTGRRAVISGVREVADILDTDKNTKASLGDWFNQTKDVTYGFGTAFPMKGNWGRAVGLFGDLVLDPINWLTLGTSIPATAALKVGATAKGIASKAVVETAEELAALGPAYIERAVAKEVAAEATRVASAQEGRKLRALIGKRITGRTSRTNLAGLADKLGASPELVQDVAKRGRVALDSTVEGQELAAKIGLKKTGLYIAGTQKRIPFTGPVAEAIQTGLVSSRVGIMGSRPLEWLAENFMPKGTSASRNMTELRRGLATGKMYIDGRLQKMDPQIARWAVRLEGADQAARSLQAQMLDSYAKIVAPLLEEPDVKAVGADFYKFLDTPEFKPNGALNWPRQLSPTERTAYDKLRAAFEGWRVDIESKYQLVDPNFQMKGIKDYLPHLMTDEARDWINSMSSARAEDILKYLKVNMTDPTASFQSRNLVKGAEFFGKTLTEEDVLGGLDTLNKIARESNRGFKGQFFETDINKIMQKYGEHFSSQYGTAEFMRIAKEGGMLSESVAMGSVTKEWIRSIADHAKMLEGAVTEAHAEMALAGRNALGAVKLHLDSMAAETGQVGKQLDELLKQAKQVGTPEERLAGIRNAKELMLKAFNDRAKAWNAFKDSLDGQTHVIDVLNKSIQNSQDTYDELMKAVDDLVNNYSERYSRMGVGLTDAPGQAQVVVGTGGELIASGDEVAEVIGRMLTPEEKTTIKLLTEKTKNKTITPDETLILNSLSNKVDAKLTTVDELIKTLDRKMEAAAAALKDSQDQWNKVMQLHNFMDNIIAGKIDITSIDGSDVYDEILDAISYDGKRAKRLPAMNALNIRKVWGAKELKDIPLELKQLKSILDPDGLVSAEMLSRIKISDIRKRLAKPAVTPTDLRELREAGIWLVVRDVLSDSELAGQLVKGFQEASTTGATQTRFSNLVELLRQADATEKYIFGEIGDSGTIAYNRSVQKLANLESQLEQLDEISTTFEIDGQIGYFGDMDEKKLAKLNEGRKLVEKRITSEKKLQERLSSRLNRHDMSAPQTAVTLNGVRDVMADLSSGISEYYLHRETVHNFKRLMQTLDLFGVAPTENMYNAILSAVAKPELDAALDFMNESKSLKELFSDMYSKINSFGLRTRKYSDLTPAQLTQIEKNLIDKIGGVPTNQQLRAEFVEQLKIDDISRSNIMMEEIAKILRAQPPTKGRTTKELEKLLEQKRLLQEHFPEIEAVWLESRTGNINQLFYKHPDALSLESAVIQELQKVGIYKDFGRPTTRRARVTTFTDEGIEEYVPKTSESADYQYQKLRGHIEKSINELMEKTNNSDIAKDLKNRYDEIIKQMQVDRKLASDAAKKVVGTKNQRQLRKRLSALASSQDGEYGYVGMLKRTFRGSEKAMTDFWGSILGGEVYDFSATRGARQYRTVLESDSFFGRLDARINSRINGLTTLVDEPNLPTEVLLDGKVGNFVDGKYVPGAWLLRTELRGPAAMANALEEHADDLLRVIGEGKDYNSELRATERKLKRATERAAKPVEEPQKVAKEAAKNIVIQQQLDDVASTPQYIRALKRESEHRFALQLARLDEESAVALGFTRAEWNSLWDDPLRPTNIASIRSQRNAYLGQRKRLLQQRGSFARTGKSTVGFDDKLQKIDDTILAVEEQILQHDSRTSALNKFAKLHDSFDDIDFQESIGLKPKKTTRAPINDSYGPDMRQIGSTVERQPYTSDEAIREFVNQRTKYNQPLMVYTKVSDTRIRRNFLSESWSSSEELQLLDEYKKLESKLDTRMHDAWIANRQGVLDHQEFLRAEISRLRGTILANDTKVSRLQEQVLAELGTTTAVPKTKYGKGLADEAKGVAKELREIDAKGLKDARVRLKNRLKSDIGREPTKEELADLFEMFDDSVRAEYVRIDKSTVEAGGTQRQLEMKAEQRAIDAWKADRTGAAKGVIGDKTINRRAFIPDTKTEETMKLLNNLRFDLIVEQGRQNDVLELLSQMSAGRKELLAEKMKQMQQLQKAMEVKERMLLPTNKANQKAVKSSESFAQASKAHQKAKEAYDAAVTFAEHGPKQIEETKKTLADIQKMAKDTRYWTSSKSSGRIKAGSDDWIAEVDQHIDDSSYMIQQISGESIPQPIRTIIGTYVDARNNYMMKSSEMTAFQQEAAFAAGLKNMEFTGSTLPLSLVGKVPPEQFNIVKTFDDGFVQLSKFFPDIGVRKEIAEIFQNVHRLNEPQMVRELSKFMGKYTKFFKAYATLTPGFHIRNGMSNTFMLFAAGAELKYLNEGLSMSRSWLEASKAGKTIEQWIASDAVPAAMKQKARDAIDAFFGAGGGLSNDFFDRGLAPKGTKKSKEFGKWIENHSRFMLAWDGVSQGLDANSASARVRKYLIDYTDVSTADQYMRQIVPFWMWTSRNLPMQLGNMWLNPKAYAIYNNIKRNISADEEGDVIPQWMTEIGAFKLPFGNNVYATADFGFNRVGQQIQELSDPTRFLANVNPLLRVPVELMGGRQLYSNRQFSDKPVEVEGGAGALLQPFLAAAGYGESRDGKNFVDDKAFYALRNLIPFLGTAERLTPSIDTYQQRGYVNPLLGFLGVPGRQVKEQEMLSELKRRNANINKIVSKEKALQGE
jgi:hypothetical protein